MTEPTKKFVQRVKDECSTRFVSMSFDDYKEACEELEDNFQSLLDCIEEESEDE